MAFICFGSMRSLSASRERCSKTSETVQCTSPREVCRERLHLLVEQPPDGTNLRIAELSEGRGGTLPREMRHSLCVLVERDAKRRVDADGGVLLEHDVGDHGLPTR